MKELPELADVLRNTFQILIDQFVEFVPRLLGAVIILVIGVGFARIIALITRRILNKVGFDKIGNRLNQIGFIKHRTYAKLIDGLVSRVRRYSLNKPCLS